MKNKLYFHSFVDLITNSSTVVFMCAGDRSISEIKNVLSTILKIAESKKSVDDIFDIYLGEKEEMGEFDEYTKSDLIIKFKDNTTEFKDENIMQKLLDVIGLNGYYNG